MLLAGNKSHRVINPGSRGFQVVEANLIDSEDKVRRATLSSGDVTVMMASSASTVSRVMEDNSPTASACSLSALAFSLSFVLSCTLAIANKPFCRLASFFNLLTFNASTCLPVSFMRLCSSLVSSLSRKKAPSISAFSSRRELRSLSAPMKSLPVFWISETWVWFWTVWEEPTTGQKSSWPHRPDDIARLIHYAPSQVHAGRKIGRVKCASRVSAKFLKLNNLNRQWGQASLRTRY